MIITPNISGYKTINLNYNKIYEDTGDANITQNIWMRWAYSFIRMCMSELGWSVSKGTGGSIGIIQKHYGSGNYQYDTNWDLKFPYEYQPIPFTLWDETTKWSEIDNYYVNTYGLDFENDRFDFILWFTSPDRNGKRMGLRFKYPIINGRDNYCCYFFSDVPVCMPWTVGRKDKDIQIIPLDDGLVAENLSAAQDKRIESIELSDEYLNKNNFYKSGEFDDYYGAGFSFLSGEKKENNSSYIGIKNETKIYEKIRESDIFVNCKNVTWKTFTTGTGINNNNYSIDLQSVHPSPEVRIVVNKSKDTVWVGIRNETNENFMSFVFGNFQEDVVTGEIKSYLIFSTDEPKGQFGNFTMTQKKVQFNLQKFINRPTATRGLTDYCGISKVILAQEEGMTPTSSLYQVFNFNSLLDEYEIYKKIFLDKDNNSKVFTLINFGKKTQNIIDGNPTVDYSDSVLLALETLEE